MVYRSASGSQFCITASSASGSEIISLYNKAAAGPSGFMKSRVCVGQELSPGASLLAVGEGQVPWLDAEESSFKLLHFSAHAEPPDPAPTLLDQEITCWLENGRVPLCITPGNLPAMSAVGPRGAQEARHLRFWFLVTKAVVLGVFSTAERFVCTLAAFVRQYKNRKPRSKHGDVLTSLHNEISHL